MSKYAEPIGWLRHEIGRVVGEGCLIELYEAEKHLKQYANTTLKAFPEANTWEFSPDVYGIFRRPLSTEFGLVFMNVSSKTLGLTELGEFLVYTKIARPHLAIQLSPSGLSRDLYSLLLDASIRDRLLKFDLNREIQVGHWNANARTVAQDALFRGITL